LIASKYFFKSFNVLKNDNLTIVFNLFFVVMRSRLSIFCSSNEMLKYSRYVFFILSVIFSFSNNANNWLKWSKCFFNVLLKTMTSSMYVLTHEYFLSILFISRWTYAFVLRWFMTSTFHYSTSWWVITINLCLFDIITRHWWKNVMQFIIEMYEQFWVFVKALFVRYVVYDIVQLTILRWIEID
jgi:hypothetical protein